MEITLYLNHPKFRVLKNATIGAIQLYGTWRNDESALSESASDPIYRSQQKFNRYEYSKDYVRVTILNVHHYLMPIYWFNNAFLVSGSEVGGVWYCPINQETAAISNFYSSQFGLSINHHRGKSWDHSDRHIGRGQALVMAQPLHRWLTDDDDDGLRSDETKERNWAASLTIQQQTAELAVDLFNNSIIEVQDSWYPGENTLSLRLSHRGVDLEQKNQWGNIMQCIYRE